ncbi:hypothetical protein QBC44DRAFT_365740 [Cladorrhinum sp. PSN332]|nr:hypothetical protein QBC44DRAFT_365740 [Cladorrhinum sp. PSN332]
MATESQKQRSDEATITSSADAASKIDSDSQNVSVNPPAVNGEPAAGAPTDEIANKHISDIIDDLVNSTEVSVSGGSDNEASKDASRNQEEDGKSHGRTSSSVKKPASFKAISVNKTFLHPKSTAPATQSKTLEKPAATLSTSPTPTSTLTASRPRLVAKSGSGLVAKSSSANGGKSAPDANAVWNKNRPVPPPEPKKYTDEELKKYGIHMASRLGPDDVKGDNWADIEDDDEDWAPETIVWSDGTKVTIPHTDEHHAPISPAPVAAQPVTQLATKENGSPPKPPAPAPVAAPAASPTPAPAPQPAPIVKTAVLASGKGLVLKGAPEKPTLVAKPPPPPTPVKSPWASIPKVEKVSPIAPPEHNNQPVSRMPPRGSFSGDARTFSREMNADDFSRTAWRDGSVHNNSNNNQNNNDNNSSSSNRELYNSQSGRLEPVSDRHAPLRPEIQQGRHPALLHRPHHEQQGPFEPSGPYAPGRNNEEYGPYGRRRGSSNVSGGSGSYHRLKTLDHPMPPPELVQARRGSMTGRSDSPTSPRNFSPSGLQGGPRHPQAQGWPPRSSPGTTHATPHYQGAQAPGGPDVLPPPLKSPLVPTASLVGVTEDDIELQKRLMRERRELALKRRQEQEAAEEAARKERIRKKLEALGPAPESNSAKKAAAKEHPPTQIQPRELTTQKPGQTDETKPTTEPLSASISEPATHSDSLPNGPQSQTLSPSDDADPQPHTHAHPWPNTARPAERYSSAGTWGPQPPQAPGKNVWGPPPNNRTLGNGTFISDLPGSLSTKPGPGPIAPPSSSRSSQSNANVPTTRLPPIGPPRSAARSEQVSEPSAVASDRETKPTAASSAWASNAVCLQDDLFSQMLSARFEERDRRLKAAGKTLADVQAPIQDTWRPTKLDADGRRADAAPRQTVQIGKDNDDWVDANAQNPIGSQQLPAVSGTAHSEQGQSLASTPSILGTQSAPGPSRSRFFPNTRDVRQESSAHGDIRQELDADDARQKSPSPPPPDMVGHPAFDGDVAHPHVSLPRPHPVVKLPPSARASSGASTGKPSFAWASQAAYKESDHSPTGPSSSNRRPSLSKTEHAWQARFDSLLGGRKQHPYPKSPSGLDFGDKPSHFRSDASYHPDFVGLPLMDASVTSKEMAEDCFEEQEMGSLPPVRIPNMVSPQAWEPCPAPKPLPKKLYADVSTADPITFPVNMSGAGTVWSVSFPGTERKDIIIPHGRNRSNPRRGGGRGGGRSTPSAPRYGQVKGRENNDQGPTSSNANSSQGRGSRGGYRGRDSRDNWSRNTSSTPIQT